MKYVLKILSFILVSILVLITAVWFGNGFTGMNITPKTVKQQIDVYLGDETYEAENTDIIDAINLPKKELIKNYEPDICLVEPSTEHANLVESVLIQFYQTDPTVLLGENKPFDVGTEAYNRLLDCDIVNYSAALSRFTDNLTQLEGRIAFLEQFEGIVIASAGNAKNEDVKNVQEFAYIKSIRPDLAHKVVIVSTAKVDEQGEIVFAQYSTGKEIDVVIPTENIYISANNVKPYTTTGTSSATPAVSGIVALYLSNYGKTSAENIKKAILSTDKTVQAGEFIYPLVDAAKMMKHEPQMITSD